MTLSPAARQRAMFLTLCFVWGTTWLAMKVGIATVPPGIFAGTRWTVAGLILLGMRKLRGEPIRATPRIAGRLVVVAVLMVTLNQIIQLYGLKWNPFTSEVPIGGSPCAAEGRELLLAHRAGAPARGRLRSHTR